MSAGSIDSWGPALWRFLHASSFAFPDVPSAIRRRQMHEFLSNVGSVLPCKTCRDHYNEYVAEHLNWEVTASRGVLAEWVVELHNSVNQRVGKRRWTVEEVRTHYETNMTTSYAVDNAGSINPLTWVIVVAIVAVVGLFVASGIRRIPN